jgi:hypothetical protein
MDRAGFNIFQSVEFLPAVFHLIDPDVASLQHPDGLLAANVPMTLLFGLSPSDERVRCLTLLQCYILITRRWSAALRKAVGTLPRAGQSCLDRLSDWFEALGATRTSPQRLPHR